MLNVAPQIICVYETLTFLMVMTIAFPMVLAVP